MHLPDARQDRVQIAFPLCVPCIEMAASGVPVTQDSSRFDLKTIFTAHTGGVMTRCHRAATEFTADVMVFHLGKWQSADAFRATEGSQLVL